MEKELQNIWIEMGEVLGGVFVSSMILLLSLLLCSISRLFKSTCQCLLNSVSREGM